MSFSFRVIWLGTNLNNFYFLSARWNSQFLAELPWNLVTIQNNSNGFPLIDVHQNATLPDSFEGGRSRVSGNCCNIVMCTANIASPRFIESGSCDARAVRTAWVLVKMDENNYSIQQILNYRYWWFPWLSPVTDIFFFYQCHFWKLPEIDR